MRMYKDINLDYGEYQPIMDDYERKAREKELAEKMEASAADAPAGDVSGDVELTEDFEEDLEGADSEITIYEPEEDDEIVLMPE